MVMQKLSNFSPREARGERCSLQPSDNYEKHEQAAQGEPDNSSVSQASLRGQKMDRTSPGV